MAQNEMIRIRLKAYDHQLIDQSAEKIVETAKRTGATVSGPNPLPTKKDGVTTPSAGHEHRATTEIYTLSLHDALPISSIRTAGSSSSAAPISA